MTLDQEFAALADSVPAFGGFFYDAQGNPTVYLTDTLQGPALKPRLLERFIRVRLAPRSDGTQYGTGLRFRQARFDFRQLSAYRDLAEEVLDREAAAVSLDIDEAMNRLVLGVRDASAVSRVESELLRRGIPDVAFSVRVEVGSQQAGNAVLSDAFRPIPGGVTINSHGGGCTLGFNINWNGNAAFVTASHCTDWFASMTDTTAFGQPASGFPINGVELVDPSPWQATSDCISAHLFQGVDKCRYSDAAIIRYNNLPNDSVQVGYIARTQSYATGNDPVGSVVIDSLNPRFEIIAKQTSFYQGYEVHRIGRASGWTAHTIANTCVTYYDLFKTGPGEINHTKVKLWCQLRLNGLAKLGDSGGPNFLRGWCGIVQYRPDGTECVYLVGLTVSYNEHDGISTVSPITGIETDFGTSLLTSLLLLASNQP